MLMRMMKGREKKKSETKLRTDRTNETESKKGQNLRYSKKNEKTVVMESKWDKNEERVKQKRNERKRIYLVRKKALPKEVGKGLAAKEWKKALFKWDL